MAVLSNNTSPCVALLIPLTVEKDDLDDKNDIGSYGISIIYSTTEYQEIVNLQDFDFNSAFSGIGGFIGIFCGYALFQVPEIFDVTNLSMLSTMFLTSCSSLFIFFASICSAGIAILQLPNNHLLLLTKSS